MAAPHSIAAMRVFLGGTPRPATLRITDGRIDSIEAFDLAADLVLPEHQVLLPGLVDSHVHLDEPGRTEWEGFLTGTAAAAAGGITTVVDMPLNSVPVTTTVPALAQKRAASVGKLAVDIAYWGGAVPENLGSLRELAQAGVVGFKCFLSPSGIDEFGHLDAVENPAAALIQATYDGAPGHPVLIGRSHGGPRAATLTGDTGARVYLRDQGALRIECSDLWSGHDIDH